MRGDRRKSKFDEEATQSDDVQQLSAGRDGESLPADSLSGCERSRGAGTKMRSH